MPAYIYTVKDRQTGGGYAMMRCSPKAFAKCPMQKICGTQQDAIFAEGSECDQFNQEIEKEKNMYENIEEWIGRGARPYVAMGIFDAAAAITGILAIISLIAVFLVCLVDPGLRIVWDTMWHNDWCLHVVVGCRFIRRTRHDRMDYYRNLGGGAGCGRLRRCFGPVVAAGGKGRWR